MVLNLNNGTASFGQVSIPFMQFPRDAPLCCNVCILAPITLPARSETTVSVKLVSPMHGYVPDGYVGIFEPHYGSHNSHIALARTVSTATNGQSTVCIMNPTIDEVCLYPGTRIGEFYSIADSARSEYTLFDPSSSPSQVAAAQKSPLPPVDLSQADVSLSELNNQLTY